MTETGEKALALINDVIGYDIEDVLSEAGLHALYFALCRAIEQHEAFKQEVSDTVHAFVYESGTTDAWDKLNSFIIPKPKPDPLVEMLNEAAAKSSFSDDDFAAKFRAALEARGFEIREKGQ